VSGLLFHSIKVRLVAIPSRCAIQVPSPKAAQSSLPPSLGCVSSRMCRDLRTIHLIPLSDLVTGGMSSTSLCGVALLGSCDHGDLTTSNWIGELRSSECGTVVILWGLVAKGTICASALTRSIHCNLPTYDAEGGGPSIMFAVLETGHHRPDYCCCEFGLGLYSFIKGSPEKKAATTWR
jgi:hypothetical protein